MSNTYMIPVSAAGKIFNTASAAGITPEKLCRAVNLDPKILQDVDNQIPFTQLIKLYDCAANLTGDEDFGLHVGEQDNPKLYGILGYVTINSQTVGEALNRLVRFQHIRTDAYKFSLEINDSHAHLSYAYRTNEISQPDRRHEAEETLSSIMKFSRMITGIDWSPREVHFEHNRPGNISEHKRIFRAPIYFGRQVTQLILDSSVLSLPLVEADLTLGSLLEQQAENLLAKIPRDEKAFAERVRQLIRENLSGGNIRMETVSRELGVSTRTFQRLLSEESTSYQKILEETQAEISEFYLQQPDIAICEISYLLGFSQPSAFHRAFRRWTGMTPKEFRKKKKI